MSTIDKQDRDPGPGNRHRGSRERDDAVAPLVMFAYADLLGHVRARSFAERDLQDRLTTGVSWVPANQAINVFGDLTGPNHWGAVGDLRLQPDPETETLVDLPAFPTPLHFFMTSAVEMNGAPWEACPRQLLGETVARLESDHGLRIQSAFEHEFTLLDGDFLDGGPFSLASVREVSPFGELLLSGLIQAGLNPEIFTSEYGPFQYEITSRPAFGIRAADHAVIVRELVRQIARSLGWRATFSPMADPELVGNGLHIHFSLVDADNGRNVTYDPSSPTDLSSVVSHFAAGVLQHLSALCAFTAPTPLSYDRLKLGKWGAGVGAIGLQNRETALRVSPIDRRGVADPAVSANLEFRAADAAGSPHLALAAMILAGIDGLEKGLQMPDIVEVDPTKLDASELQQISAVPLPESFEDALREAEESALFEAHIPRPLWETYALLKREELRQLDILPLDDICERYTRVY